MSCYLFSKYSLSAHVPDVGDAGEKKGACPFSHGVYILVWNVGGRQKANKPTNKVIISGDKSHPGIKSSWGRGS